MKIKIIEKTWMEKMHSREAKIEWCCKEAKKHLILSGDRSFVYIDEYYPDSYTGGGCRNLIVNYCPFCGSEIEIE